MAEIASLIGAFVAGLLGGVGLKIVFDRSKRTTTVTQTGNKAGRDVIGGDVDKRKK